MIDAGRSVETSTTGAGAGAGGVVRVVVEVVDAGAEAGAKNGAIWNLAPWRLDGGILQPLRGSPLSVQHSPAMFLPEWTAFLDLNLLIPNYKLSSFCLNLTAEIFLV